MSTYDAIAELPVRIDSVEYSRRQRATTSGFTRVSTIVQLHGDGFDRKNPAFRHSIPGVDCQIHQNLFNLRGVSHYP